MKIDGYDIRLNVLIVSGVSSFHQGLHVEHGCEEHCCENRHGTKTPAVRIRRAVTCSWGCCGSCIEESRSRGSVSEFLHACLDVFVSLPFFFFFWAIRDSKRVHTVPGVPSALILNAGPSARIVAVPPILATRITENLSPTNPSLGIVHDADPEIVWRFENSANGPVNSCFDCDLFETEIGPFVGK